MEANRRTIIRGAGAAGVIGGTAAFTSACGADDQGQEPGQGQESGQAGAASIPAGDVPVGSGTVVDETYVVTQPKAGEFHAFTSVCTHQGCQVRTVTEEQIVCPCHGSQFSTTTGEVIEGPATKPLQAFTVEESDGTLTIS